MVKEFVLTVFILRLTSIFWNFNIKSLCYYRSHLFKLAKVVAFLDWASARCNAPNLLILYDASGSMLNFHASGGNSVEYVAEPALVDYYANFTFLIYCFFLTVSFPYIATLSGHLGILFRSYFRSKWLNGKSTQLPSKTSMLPFI